MGDSMMRHILSIALIATIAPGAAGRRDAAAPAQSAAAEPTTLDVTSWTEQTELYMEHPPFVAGETVRFAVHLTRLADFQALNAGRPSIEMTPEAGGSATV